MINGSRVIFPNLRIIRGRSGFRLNNRHQIVLRIHNVNASEIILPRLTEISRGGIHITGSSQLLSHLRGVLWSDIIDQTQFIVLLNNIFNGQPKGGF